MIVTVFWMFYLHPKKALKNDKLGLLVMCLSHIVRPAMFVVYGGTSFAHAYSLMIAAYWLTSKSSGRLCDTAGRLKSRMTIMSHLCLRDYCG